MYLKSIEIQGFKSFANKINFKFHNGITAIVGPNGSGKSNVADAVRWVLGEQRIKQLRGASMQDVIFSGTEMRKPLSCAYVAITLDNSDHKLAIDYEEVTVARRLYRSGESEYLLNGTACRLRDINELFYDTGIGKEGYSIIGQGQIDKILSGKPEERRELFDEAAGIVKFKHRKAAAARKLEEEQANFVRVNDILSELEKQIGPLERQSEKARIYLRKKEELKNLDINCFLLENERLQTEITQVEEKRQIVSDDYAQTAQKFENIRREYEAATSAIAACEARMEESRTAVSEAELLRGRLEGQINVYKEQIRSAENNEEHFQNRSRALEAEIESRGKELAALLEKRKELDAQMEEISARRDEARTRLDQVLDEIDSVNGQVDAIKAGVLDGLNEKASVKTRLSRFDTMLEQHSIRRAQIQAKLLEAEPDDKKREENIQSLEEEVASIGAELSDMEKQIGDKESQVARMRAALTKSDEEYRSIQAHYHAEHSRLEALVNLAERYEGYGGSVRKVMEQKPRTPGIIGVVADILKVEQKYETAIETALGGSIQNIVTDNEETAKKLIAYLKETKGGRATFLPLTSIRNVQEFRQKECMKEQGVIGLADTLVHCEKAYINVARSLLGRILVVDNIDHAVAIARKYRYSIRMVTLEGEMIVPGGAISGGAFKNNSNLLGRRRETEELQKKVASLEKELDRIQNQIEKQKNERNTYRVAVEMLKSSQQTKYLQLNTARLNLEALCERRQEAEEGQDALNLEYQQITGEVGQINEEKKQAAEELAALDEKEKTSDDQVRELQTKLEELRDRETKETFRVSQWDMEVQAISQNQNFHEQNVDRVRTEIDHCQVELDEIKSSILDNQSDVEYKQASIEELTRSIEQSYEVQKQAQEALETAAREKETCTGKQQGFFTEREETSAQMSRLDKEIFRLNAQREKLEESAEAQINYMWSEYEMTLSEAMKVRREDMGELGAMKSAIAQLKAEIKKLGDVNVNAIEDYKNLMERYTFLKTQHDDLEQAQKTLLGIIDELDGAMRKQFAEKFGEISREFNKVFQELFGGGRGTLELMEDEDILEAGIRIIAQPPGKKLQNMMQLSGGEKSLTAIALLFAIQNLKPSPFCLLDEIEAALDESNVDRFAKYLHKLTEHTQFIVITHRRGTMSEADRLYGITMQEKGVSTLVSVNLIEEELT
ncbi:MAG: chromosome segregation protein SMC [Lachnospiraceae bacterium]|nr:chromosome segregation protein SMC [Lachnospiraceae bacterium]